MIFVAYIKTVSLNGEELCVALPGRNCCIRNLGSEMIYASVRPGIVPEADGVLGVPAGAVDTLYDTCGTVCLKGNGKAQLVGSDYDRGCLGGSEGSSDACTDIGADIVKFSTHNLLSDSTVKLGGTYSSFTVNGEKVTCNIAGNPQNIADWFKFTSNITFKTNRLYKISVSEFKGYGRIGISTAGDSVNIHLNENKNAACINGNDNHLITPERTECQFLIVPASAHAKTQTAIFLFCPDPAYNDGREAFSFDIALYEQE